MNCPQVLNHNENFPLDNLPGIPSSSPNPLKTCSPRASRPGGERLPGEGDLHQVVIFPSTPTPISRGRSAGETLRRSTAPLQGQYGRKWDLERVANHPGLRAASSRRLPRRRPPALGANRRGTKRRGRGRAGRLPVPRWRRARERRSCGDLAARRPLRRPLRRRRRGEGQGCGRAPSKMEAPRTWPVQARDGRWRRGARPGLHPRRGRGARAAAAGGRRGRANEWRRRPQLASDPARQAARSRFGGLQPRAPAVTHAPQHRPAAPARPSARPQVCDAPSRRRPGISR